MSAIRTLDDARRDYTFRLPESSDDRCHSCIWYHREKSDCIQLDIAIANAKKSRCPVINCNG